MARDVLVRGGGRWLVVFEGVSDRGTAEATETAQKQVADELLAAYEDNPRRARAAGLLVYGATIAQFGGNADYDDPGGLREATRRAVNDWIRESGRLDATLEFDW